MHRVAKLGFQKVLMVVGPMQTSLPNYDWAKGVYPQMTAALGALHALYKVRNTVICVCFSLPITRYLHDVLSIAPPSP